MEMLKNKGAEKIICAVSLPLFTGDAVESFEAAYQKGLFDTIIGTNAVYHTDAVLGRGWYVSARITSYNVCYTKLLRQSCSSLFRSRVHLRAEL